MSENKGLTMPGRCDSCGANGLRFHFRNIYAEPEINFDLCHVCMIKALLSMSFFKRTPAGKKAIEKRRAREA